MTKQKRLEASLYKGLRHMREVIYKALVVKDPGVAGKNIIHECEMGSRRIIWCGGFPVLQIF